MRLGIISDVHSNSIALRAVLKELASRGVDGIICAGDLVGYNPFPNEVVDIIRKIETDITVILGNHDVAVLTGSWALFNPDAAKATEWTVKKLTQENRAYLGSLQRSRSLEIRGKKIGLFHGSPYGDDDYVFPKEICRPIAHPVCDYLKAQSMDVLILGHSHQQWCMDFTTGTYTDRAVKGRPIKEVVEDGSAHEDSRGIILNPGSVGQPRDGDWRASYAILEIDGTAGKSPSGGGGENGGLTTVSLYRVEYDVESVISEMNAQMLPNRLSERLRHGR